MATVCGVLHLQFPGAVVSQHIGQQIEKAFAEKAGFSYKYYQAIEAGRKRELRLSTLDRLAAAHGLECWQLLHPDLPNLPPRTSKSQKIERGKARNR